MKPADDREEVLFREALQRPKGRARDAFLDGACAGDEALRARLEALLQTRESRDPFLEPQSASPGSTTVVVPLKEGPGTVIGRYKILEKVGEGGCGVVYVAEQREPVKRRVALKIIKLGMDTRQVVARFEAERQALALMDHPNIAKVLDGGATDTGRPYFVMELVKGIPITHYCDQEKLATRERLDLFIQVCHAIQHAHQKGIIHRDIKPSNIMVTLHDGVPVPKVIDFGIAKATQAELTEKTVYTQLQQFIGTPAYMSPEQAEMSGLDIDTRSDIYSLGVLLYELLTGSTPFDTQELLKSGLDQMRKIIREREPVRPSTRLGQTATVRVSPSQLGTLHSSLATDLDWIVMKCLEKDRRRRYETANGLAQDIERHLKHEPVVARPPSLGYRLQKSFRRNRVVFTAAAVVAAALVLGVVVSTWQAVSATKARRDEAAARLQADEAAWVAKHERERAEKEAQSAKASELVARENLYAANMNLVQQAWEQNDVGPAERLLTETATHPDRGFEWYYWQRQTHQVLKTLQGHFGYVMSVAYSPDGRRIVTGSLDTKAKVWDAASGRELFTLRVHGAQIWSVAFSPDGQRIVASGSDGTAKVWDAPSFRELVTLKGHGGMIWAVSFSPDSRRIVTCSNDRTAKVWEVASGKELLTFKEPSAGIGFAAFSQDSQRISTLGWDGTAKVWDAASGLELFTAKLPSGAIAWAAFSPDGQRIVTGSGDGTAKVWNAASGAELLTVKPHSGRILYAAFSPDGQRIVTGSDRTAKVWMVADGEELLTLKGHAGLIGSMAFSPDGQRIVTGSYDQTAKMWEVGSSREPHRLKAHSGPVGSVAFSPDSQWIVTGSADQTARLWEAGSGRELRALMGHSAAIRSVAVSPNGQRIVTGGDDRTARVWDAGNGLEQLTLKGHAARIWSVAFSPDGQRIVTGSDDRTAKVWDSASGQELLTLKGHTARTWSVAFSPDGRRIVTGSGDRAAKVWEAITGRELLTFTNHNAPVRSVAFSPDSLRIVTGSDDQTAGVWDATSGKELFMLKGHTAPIGSVAFSPDGRRIVTGSAHDVFSGSGDSTAKVWDAASGRELLTLKGHRAPVNSVAFAPNGRWIVSGSDDGTARVWEAAQAEQVAVWREEEREAVKHLAALQGEWVAEQEHQRIARSRLEGTIKRWLLLAPVPLPRPQSAAEGLVLEQIESEGQLKPKAGETTAVANRELQWQELALDDYVIDFNALVGGVMTGRCVAYAVCYIWSDAEQHGLQMLVGSDDESKVYLNGKEVYRYDLPRSFLADQDVVPDVTLVAGRNVLVFKVANEGNYWMGSIRLTGAAGQPVKGIRVVLDPRAKD